MRQLPWASDRGRADHHPSTTVQSALQGLVALLQATG